MRQSTLGSSTVTAHRTTAIAKSPKLAIEQHARPYSLDMVVLNPYALAIETDQLAKAVEQRGWLHPESIATVVWDA